MPKGDKYIGLTNYLKSNNNDIYITMTFDEIENQVGDKLPASAYKYKAFWSNTHTHSVAYGWLDAGYRTINIDFNMKIVTFKKE